MNESTVGTVRKKVERAYSKLSGACSHLFSLVVERFPFPFVRDEGGQFGLGGIFVAIMLAAIVGITLGMMGALEFIVRQIAEGVHLTAILVHIPQIEVEGMMFPVQWSGALPPFLKAASGAGGSLYSTFQLLSVAVLTIGFMFIGLSFILEQFNVMGRGTAEKLLSESVLILILILIFPYFFNASAAALNATDEGMILSPTVPGDAADEYGLSPGSEVGPRRVTSDIATAAGTAPGGVFPDVGLGAIGDFIHAVSPDRAIAVLVTMTASFMAVMIAFATGVFKIIATVALAAAFPLILSLRLIPFLRDVSDRLTSSLIGLMLASLVIAIFFRVGWEILVVVWTDFTFRWAIGVALLMAAAGAFTITAPALSGMSGEISGTMGRSTAGAIGGMVATGGTAALGGVAGAAGAGATAIKGGAGKAGLSKAMGKGLGKGTLRGAPGQDVVGSMKAGAGGGKEAGLEHVASESPLSGQSQENIAQSNQNLDNHALAVQEADSETVSREAEQGRETARAIDGMSDEESIKHVHNMRTDTEGEMSDTELEAHMEKGEITGDEARHTLKKNLKHAKDKDISEDEAYAAFRRTTSSEHP